MKTIQTYSKREEWKEIKENTRVSKNEAIKSTQNTSSKDEEERGGIFISIALNMIININSGIYTILINTIKSPMETSTINFTMIMMNRKGKGMKIWSTRNITKESVTVPKRLMDDETLASRRQSLKTLVY